MNYGYKFNEIKGRLERALNDIEEIKKDFDDAGRFTDRFLSICKKLGIDKVAIGVVDKSVDGCKGWPFGADGSIFSNDSETAGWSSIWKAVEIAGISGSCGNSNQHSADTSRLVDGVYHLKSGKWQRVDES